jgi:hypothetical protein
MLYGTGKSSEHSLLEPKADIRYQFEPMFVKTKGKFLPEKRLPITMYGGLLFPVTMFWFAWSAVRVHWISPVLAGTIWTSATDWM